MPPRKPKTEKHDPPTDADTGDTPSGAAVPRDLSSEWTDGSDAGHQRGIHLAETGDGLTLQSDELEADSAREPGSDAHEHTAAGAAAADGPNSGDRDSHEASEAGVGETGGTEVAEVAEPAIEMPSLAANISDQELARVCSALIFASTKPISASRLAELLSHAPTRIRAALMALDETLRSAGAPFRLAEIAGGFRYMTDESVAKFVAALRGEQKKERLSGAALETLAIVAYRQPVTKGEIEAMRGVQAGPMLKMLLDKRLVRITGRAQVPGRPLQYGTTREFLDKFNLASLKDLPTVDELAKP